MCNAIKRCCGCSSIAHLSPRPAFVVILWSPLYVIKRRLWRRDAESGMVQSLSSHTCYERLFAFDLNKFEFDCRLNCGAVFLRFIDNIQQVNACVCQ